jgi:hypothetical protein
MEISIQEESKGWRDEGMEGGMGGRKSYLRANEWIVIMRVWAAPLPATFWTRPGDGHVSNKRLVEGMYRAMRFVGARVMYRARG